MNYHGDIPEDHLILLAELRQLENWFNEYGDQISALSSSKGFLCMAHDFYLMYMEEEGERLLKLVEKHSPGYFKGPILSHMDRDSGFAMVVRNLKETQALELMISLGFDSEQG